MRLNRFVAAATGKSRRAADTLITDGKIMVNGKPGAIGQTVEDNDVIELDSERLVALTLQTIVLNKPVGYVASRLKQDERPTIYELLPPELHHLKPVGRLDAESSGLMVLTNDGELAHRLAHPSKGKLKRYVVELDRKLTTADHSHLEQGIKLNDGLSRLHIKASGGSLIVSLGEGRNRQIRRSFGALKYRVDRLHRINLGDIELGDLASGQWRDLTP